MCEKTRQRYPPSRLQPVPATAPLLLPVCYGIALLMYLMTLVTR